MLKPARQDFLQAIQYLEHNNLLVMSISLEKPIETTKCWIYFTDAEMPCYRATFYSHYSPFNVPNGDISRYSSLMCEASIPKGETVDAERMLDQVTEGLIRAGILEEGNQRTGSSRGITALWIILYPIPTLERDRALNLLQPALLGRICIPGDG